jgi:hypothetical protein
MPPSSASTEYDGEMFNPVKLQSEYLTAEKSKSHIVSRRPFFRFHSNRDHQDQIFPRCRSAPQLSAPSSAQPLSCNPPPHAHYRTSRFARPLLPTLHQQLPHPCKRATSRYRARRPNGRASPHPTPSALCAPSQARARAGGRMTSPSGRRRRVRQYGIRRRLWRG